MEENGIFEVQQKAYQEKEQQIKDKEKGNTDWSSSISSNKNYISDFDSKIQSNKSKLNSISDEAVI